MERKSLQLEKGKKNYLNRAENRVLKPQPISTSLSHSAEHNLTASEFSMMKRPYSVCGTIQSSRDCGAFESANRAYVGMASKKIPIMLPSFSTLKPKDSFRMNRPSSQSSGMRSKCTSIALNHLNKKILSMDSDNLFS